MTIFRRNLTVYFSLFLFLNLFGGFVAAQKDRSIHDIQGEGNLSPFTEQIVRVSGIVTARIRSGFFLQTPDDKIDNNPKTSEGVFVFTKTEPPAQATIGNLVTMTGKVTEFRYKTDNGLMTTEISFFKDKDTITVDSKANPLPKPVAITIDDFKSNKVDQLERFEGMRVSIDALMAVSPTGGKVDEKKAISESDGLFYAVLKGIPRPFREVGLGYFDVIENRDELKKNHPKTPVFDENPESFRVDTAAQLGSQPVEVTSMAEVKGIVGVVHYDYKKYAILKDVDCKPIVSGLIKAKSLPPLTDGQFSIAAMNIERFFDDTDAPETQEPIVTPDAFQLRMTKISMAVRLYLQTPDVVATIETENLAALKRLAEKINADAVAAGKSDPKYDAFLAEGNDIGGIDSGFLVKTSRVKVIETKQFGKAEMYKRPDGKDELLNDRPPLMLRASIENLASGKPVTFTVIVNHLKSFRGIDDPKDGARVRLKKKLQAEFLAKLVNERQKNDPNEKILLVGDFNAFQFNDGLVDVIGTIKGSPTPADQLMVPTEDLVNPDLIDLVDFIDASQRYSYSFGGNAQTIDHFLLNPALKKNLLAFGFARLNADFPESYRGNINRVERFSDHDSAIGYFNLFEK